MPTSFAFISLVLASMFEMFDNTTTDFIYVNHSSIFNWLFYSFISIGYSFFTISVGKSKLIIASNILVIIASFFLLVSGQVNNYFISCINKYYTHITMVEMI